MVDITAALSNLRHWRRENAYGALYFTVQRLRRAVTRQRIRQASLLLDGSWEQIRNHAGSRIATLHQPLGDPFEWLQRQGLVNRSDLRETMERAARSRRRKERRRTSGSTGTPFRFVKDMEMCAWMDAVMWAVYGWHGVEPGAPHARFWGRKLGRFGRMRQQATDLLLNRRRFDAFQPTPERTRAFYFSLRRLRPEYVYGYPTLITHFAAECMRQNLLGSELGVRLVITTGELLSPAARSTIESFFEARVVNEYGCTESGVLGFECEHGSMHCVPVAAWPEIIRGPDNAHHPGTGEVVVTDLFGSVAPLVRYRLHDCGSIVAVNCGCGRFLPVLEIHSGRLDSFILTPGRGRVYDAILAYTVPKAIERFRARQVALGLIEVDLVPGPGFDVKTTPSQCSAAWEACLGPGMTVRTRVVSDIPLESTGKLRYFVPLPTEPAASEPSRTPWALTVTDGPPPTA